MTVGTKTKTRKTNRTKKSATIAVGTTKGVRRKAGTVKGKTGKGKKETDNKIKTAQHVFEIIAL